MTIQLFFILSAATFGLLVGSFLNVVIYRLPVMLFRDWEAECRDFLSEKYGEQFKSEAPSNTERFNLAVPRSRCPNCNHLIRAWENIPVISYIVLGGKCSNCATPISIRYPLIELLTGVLSALVAWHFGFEIVTIAALGLTFCLISLTFIDIDHQLLPDNITLPLLWLGIFVNAFGLITDLQSAVFGAIFGYLSLWSVFWLFKLVTGKEGMGFGDFKLLAALGAWLGWQMLPLVVILSSFVGAFIGIGAVALANKDKNKPIPFGPYLAIAGFIALIWGEVLVNTYLNLLKS